MVLLQSLLMVAWVSQVPWAEAWVFAGARGIALDTPLEVSGTQDRTAIAEAAWAKCIVRKNPSGLDLLRAEKKMINVNNRLFD